MAAELRITTYRIALMALGLALCLYAGCPRPAYAQEIVLPPGTWLKLPQSDTPLVLQQSAFIVSRDAMDRANATAAVNEKLTDELQKCARQVRASREPAWRAAVKWTAIGVAVGAAFALGATL